MHPCSNAVLRNFHFCTKNSILQTTMWRMCLGASSLRSPSRTCSTATRRTRRAPRCPSFCTCFIINLSPAQAWPPASMSQQPRQPFFKMCCEHVRVHLKIVRVGQTGGGDLVLRPGGVRQGRGSAAAHCGHLPAVRYRTRAHAYAGKGRFCPPSCLHSRMRFLVLHVSKLAAIFFWLCYITW